MRSLAVLASKGNRAADALLLELYHGVDGKQVRSRAQVLAGLIDIMRRRQLVIDCAARQYGASGLYDELAWKEWLRVHPFDEKMMEDAVKMWKGDFEAANPNKKENVDRAWKNDLEKSCGSPQLAVALLKHPTIAATSARTTWARTKALLIPLLESWEESKSSCELRGEGERCNRRKRRRRSKITPETREATRVSRLHILGVHMERYSRDLLEKKIVAVAPQHVELYNAFMSGCLDRELQELQPELLGPPGLTRIWRV